MKIIKTKAINSTNLFLKEMLEESFLENFTVVTAEYQTSGKGQMHTKWLSEPGKNLMFSVYCKFSNLLLSEQRFLNFAVSVSIFRTLDELGVPNLAIKWPNDIMVGKYKICGTLIENITKANMIKESIIGIGINVNQEKFSEDLSQASSIKNILNKEIDLETLLNSTLQYVKESIGHLKAKNYKFLEDFYLRVLYKKNIPTMFKDRRNVLFLAKIIGVNANGKLLLELDDETLKEFGLKEVSFA